ncbi:DUF429 domain-containing protein [Nocardioides sp.]|uniref:DUF429 domain-containing protein n=1 Tax=Nocardioides sp. TaxID=35761 RepID=UPI002869F803|nr:DUF429 domain-containing protein [Nocardioides sp.]
MHHIGIDLAWGERQPTGVAVLDDDARLLALAAVRTDGEIAAVLAAYVDGECLVAIDAPLIVTNPTGSRDAEKALSKDFRRFEAGTHPSNLGKPEFADGTRGARVSSLLGLDMNPRSGRARRAIEVYPHPATVVLFGLPRTLKYKAKAGRDLELLRSELLTLMSHVESVVTTEADPTWAALREQAETATRKSQLRVVEDQVDAVVCAYVALFRQRHPERVTTYGDFETGYIVTPSLPDAHAATQEYAAQQPALIEAGRQFVALVTGILDEAGINYLSVTGRTKGVQSFAKKAARTVDGRPVFTDPLREITDQIGVRVITYVHSDVSAVADLLGDQVVVKEDRDMGQETASQGRFGYASRHLLIELDAARESDRALAALRGRVAQVQVRTVLQHAWAEFEHDIRYKGDVPLEHARDLDRRFTLAAGLLELADQEFSTIRERLRSSGPTGLLRTEEVPDDPRIDPRELAAFLAGQYDDAGWSRTDHYAWISGLLLELGITSLEELADVLRSLTDDLNERMDYRYPPGAVRRLDDALLAAYAERYVDLHGNDHRRDALAARLAKVRG